MKKDTKKQVINKSQAPLTDQKSENPLYKKLALLLFLVSALVYANSYFNEYCLDDANLITENSITQKGFAGIGDHLTKDLLYGYLQGAGKNAGSSGWRPLPSITFSMEIGFWGKDKPHISHLINILLYGLTVITLFRFLSKYLLKETWVSFCTTLLFAIHPIHTEVVANIKSRDEILCLLFLLFSLIHFWKYLDVKKTGSLAMSLILFFLSLTCKETSLTFVAGLPVMIYFTRKDAQKKLGVAIGAFFGIAAVYMLIRNSIAPLSNISENKDVMNNPFLYATGSESLGTKMYVLLLFIRLLIIPHPLTYDYSWKHIDYVSLGSLPSVFSIVLYTFLLILGLRGIKSKNIFSFGILMFLITMSVTIAGLLLTGFVFGERLLFIPSIFFCLLMVLAGKYLLEKLSVKFNLKKTVVAICLIAPFTVVGSILTVDRNPDWKNMNTLNLADIHTSPNSARLNNGVGASYLADAFADTSSQKRDSLIYVSIGYFNKAIEIYPQYDDALLNLGLSYGRMNNLEKADEYWSNVRARHPGNRKLLMFNEYLALNYLNHGMKKVQQNQIDSAFIYFSKAVPVSYGKDSLMTACYYHLGLYYYNKADYKQSNDYFGKVMQINPDFLNAREGYMRTDSMVKTMH